MFLKVALATIVVAICLIAQISELNLIELKSTMISNKNVFKQQNNMLSMDPF